MLRTNAQGNLNEHEIDVTRDVNIKAMTLIKALFERTGKIGGQ